MEIDQYINDGQDPKVVEKLLLKLQDILASSGEEITYIAVQKKPAVTLFPNSIALTSKRVFLCISTKLGLATDFEIIPWQDISSISFKEGFFGSRMQFSKHNNEIFAMAYIPDNQVRKLYQLGMEALQGAMSNAATDRANTSSTVDVTAPNDELTLKLKKLKALFEQELITEAEYENKKNELLSQL